MLVVAAFVAGRGWQPTAPPSVATTASASFADRIFEVELDDHLNRAEAALVEFLTGQPGALAETERTEDLIAANRLYREVAVTSGNTSVAEVLDELERALIEMDALSPDIADEADSVRAWIDSRGLLFKVRVMREALQEPLSTPVSNQRQDAL